MKTNRIEAFSDGVMAIIITIMVLELKAPHDPTPASLAKMWPTLFAYVLSFIIIAIYWVNHHHLIHLIARVDSVILWANINLLFWLSLISLGHRLPRRQSRAAVSCCALCCCLRSWRNFVLSAARIDRAPSSRPRIQSIEQKDDAKESHRDFRLRCRNSRRVRLYPTCLDHDRLTGSNVFSS
jgi:uncharacterized membrane protein